MTPSFWLLVGCCWLTLTTAISANDTLSNNPSENITSSSLDNGLGSEEMRYIRLECEGFADEDKIAEELRAPYIETCIEELSAAVKQAIDQLSDTNEVIIADENEDTAQ